MNTSSKSSLALFGWPLDRTLLVEASAGTGKTWTITGLYVRHIVESALPVENVLVVTYTEAATKELRSRIRTRLVEMREALDHGDCGDAFLGGMLASIDDRENARRALDSAISGFDQAAVYTIHGFCQRVLAESAFESASAFEAEVLASERELKQEICDDFWRQVVIRQPRAVIESLVDSGVTPESLAGWVGESTSRSWVQVIEPDPVAVEEYGAIEPRFAEAYSRTRSLWRAHRDEVSELLLDTDALKRNSYKVESIRTWLEAMDGILHGEIPHHARFDKFERFTNEALAKGVKKDKEPPRHVFFDACSELASLDERIRVALDDQLKRLKAAFREFMVDNLAARKEVRRLHSFDDLLRLVKEALDGPMGEQLAARLRGRYRAAMIDEFQDTDPVQLEIFKRIYGAGVHSRIFVGDPKQSIYSFRGADVFAYLEGRRLAARQETLDRNHRSDPVLVRAVNALFERCRNPFVFDTLDYPTVEGEDKNSGRLRDAGGPGARLELRFLARDAFSIDGKPITKQHASAAICRDVANRIGELLEPRSATLLDQRPLSGGDIAVLVRTHAQARRIHEALAEAGIAAVRQGAGSVFASVEAEAIEHILRGVAEPGRDRPLRTALASDIVGYTACDLQGAAARPERWESLVEQFRRYHVLWRDHGFMSMFRTLLVEQGVYERTLARADGERAMTNVLHLAELLQGRAHETDDSMEALIKWLSDMRASADRENEEDELRLESDADRVQIVTMHRSKGLEYPVVFCPFAWDGSLRSGGNEEVLFHDPDDGFRAKVDLGSNDFEKHRELALREELAESVRLLYVALTRAGQRCVVYWGSMKDAGTSALAWLIHLCPRLEKADWSTASLASLFDTISDEKLLADLHALRGYQPGGITVDHLDPVEPARRVRLAATTRRRLAARTFERELRPSWKVTSFSALTSGAADDSPDHDASVREPLEPEVRENLAETSIHRYPRGARTGLCWHSLLEELDFIKLDDRLLHEKVMQALPAHGIDPAWASATGEMIRCTLDVDLDPPRGMRLRDVTRSRRLSELAFFYPVSSLEAAPLAELLLESGAPFAEDYARSVARFRFEPVKGYVRGFVDLVFEHDGRYYLVDYKSNWLGPNAASYDASNLLDAMTREGYFLQYLLYTVALDRFLAARLPDYDRDSHFGGVYYLFLRGLDAGASTGRGIFFDRPPSDLVRRLDAYLRGAAGPRA